jgi:long-chain fatty acid transport protein
MATVLSAAWLGAATGAFALGFRNPDQSARATGQGEAFVAQADDASAIYYNPGGLTQLRGTQLTSGAYVTFRDWQFKGDVARDGITAPAFLPHFYGATDLGLEQWRFGLGFNIPFGNSVDWGDHGPLRYMVTQASLAVYNIEPTVAYKINDHLSIGVGLNIYDGTTSLKNYQFLPTGHLHFEGDGMAVGATVGALWKINEQHSLGLVYRSPFEIDFVGSIELTPVAGKTDAKSTIKFPQSIAAGYAYRPVKQLKLEVDVEWTNWNPLNTVSVVVPANKMLNGKTGVEFNWKDSFFYEFGAQYDFNETWAVRAGYIFSENTVPNSTFSPNLPDSNRHVFSVGLGYSSKLLNVDLTYQYSLSDDRTVKTGPAAGEWRTQAHALMATSTWKF